MQKKEVQKSCGNVEQRYGEVQKKYEINVEELWERYTDVEKVQKRYMKDVKEMSERCERGVEKV